MRGLSRFINAVSRCTLSRLRRAWCPTLPTPAALLPALGDPPCIILGPGEPSMAHQTDEYCLLSRLAEAEQLYGKYHSRLDGITAHGDESKK